MDPTIVQKGAPITTSSYNLAGGITKGAKDLDHGLKRVRPSLLV